MGSFFYFPFFSSTLISFTIFSGKDQSRVGCFSHSCIGPLGVNFSEFSIFLNVFVVVVDVLDS